MAYINRTMTRGGGQGQCMQLLGMGQILTSIHTAWIAGQIVARHTREGEPCGAMLRDTFPIALAMSRHPRLGEKFLLSRLEPGVFQLIH